MTVLVLGLKMPLRADDNEVELCELTGVVVVKKGVEACAVDMEVLGVDYTKTLAKSAVA